MKNNEKFNRLDYLDSLRGIAALMVCFGHFINWNNQDLKIVKVASIVFNPNDAVSFFFVLSGMVLSYPYLQFNKKLDIGKFYIARIFRIFPSFLITLFIVLLYYSRNDIAVFTSAFFHNNNKFWNEAMLILGVNNLYFPGWTLTIELCISFFMPFFILVAKYDRKLLPWLLLCVFLSAKITGLFFFHFVLGIIISAYFKEISESTFKNTWLYKNRIFVLLLAFPCFSLRQIVYSIANTAFSDSLYFVKLGFFVLSGLAAFVFVIFIIYSNKAQHIFQHPVLVFYGRISYGIYLMHFVFVVGIWDHWQFTIRPLFQDGRIAFVTTALLYFVAFTIAATILHYAVELPFIRLGKRLGEKMKTTVTVN